MKKIIFIILLLLCVFMFVSCEIVATFDFELEPDGKSYAISGGWKGVVENIGDIRIPDSHERPSDKDSGFNEFEFLGMNFKLFNTDLPVTRIVDRGFQDEERITSLRIPVSIKVIGSYAFAGCTSLATIKFEGTVEEWNAIKKGNCWNQDVPATEVICSNGTVSLK